MISLLNCRSAGRTGPDRICWCWIKKQKHGGPLISSCGYCYMLGSDTAQYQIFRRSTWLEIFEFKQQKIEIDIMMLTSRRYNVLLPLLSTLLAGLNFANLAIRSVPCATHWRPTCPLCRFLPNLYRQPDPPMYCS